MVKTAVVSWTKYETVLNIILNILVDSFSVLSPIPIDPCNVVLKQQILINLRAGVSPGLLSFIRPPRSWFVPNPILSTFLSCLHTLCKWNGENFKFDELWLVHWWTNFGSMFDLRSWKLAPFYHLIWPDWDGIDFRDNRRCKAGLMIVVASLGWLIRWGSHSAEFSAVNHLREQLAMG